MDLSQFSQIMSGLVQKYGKSVFDDTKCRLIFDEVQHLSPQALQECVDFFIGEDIKAKLSDFKTHARRYGGASGNTCNICEGTGWDRRRYENYLGLDENGFMKFESDVPDRCRCVGGRDGLFERIEKDYSTWRGQVDHLNEVWFGRKSEEPQNKVLKTYVDSVYKKLPDIQTHDEDFF